MEPKMHAVYGYGENSITVRNDNNHEIQKHKHEERSAVCMWRWVKNLLSVRWQSSTVAETRPYSIVLAREWGGQRAFAW